MIARAEQLFHAASVAVAENPTFLSRVKKERLGIALTKIYRHQEFLPTPAAYELAITEFTQTAARHGITHLSEGGQRPLAAEVKKWRAALE